MCRVRTAQNNLLHIAWALFSHQGGSMFPPPPPSQKGNRLLRSLWERADFTPGCTTRACVLQTRSRPVGFSSHLCRRCAGQPCLLLCRVVLQGKPQNTAALATPAARQKNGQFNWKEPCRPRLWPYVLIAWLQRLWNLHTPAISEFPTGLPVFGVHTQSFVHKPEAGEAYGHSGGTIGFRTCFFFVRI